MERLVGHARATSIIDRALASGRLHHAWIFSGPRGVGKHLAAVEFARIRLDPAAAPDAAGRLRADAGGRVAHLVDAGSHPDLHLVSKELALVSDNASLRSRKLTTIPIDLIREHVIGGRTGDDRVVDGPAYRTAAMGHGKVFIFDEAELMDATVQNALLKTLEEPPKGTSFVLVTSRPERLLPTVQSRCQHVRFAPLAPEEMEEWARRTAFALDCAAREWTLRYAAGAPGIAVLAAEHDFFDWHRRIAAMAGELARGHWPPALGATLAEFVEAYAEAWVKGHRNASKDAANKDGAGHALALLAFAVRDALAEEARAGGDCARSLRAADLLAETERDLASNVNMKQAFEALVARWAAA